MSGRKTRVYQTVAAKYLVAETRDILIYRGIDGTLYEVHKHGKTSLETYEYLWGEDWMDLFKRNDQGAGE